LLLAAAHGFTADHGSVDDFTESVLGWYKKSQQRGWCLGRGLSDRVFVHAELGSSGARVFAPQGALRDPDQDVALADYIQGSMMVRYNGTKRGTSF